MKILFNTLILFCLVFISCRGTTSKEPPIHLLQNMDDGGRLDPQSQNLASYEVEAEPFEDLNGDGVWNEGEEFEDLNSDSLWNDKSIEYISSKTTSMQPMPNNTVYTDLSAEEFIDALNGKYDYGEEFIDALNGKYDYGEEFIDTNNNGEWDEGEEFIDALNGKYDLGEEFTDVKNGWYDKGEEFIDVNNNGKWDEFIEIGDEQVEENYRLNTGKDQNGGFIEKIPIDLTSESEPFEDLNNNGKYDEGEEFIDLNRNHKWDDRDAELIAFVNRGEERYNIYCSVCHGVSGNGEGIVLSEKYSWKKAVKPVSLLDLSDREDISKDGYLFDVITNGKNRMGGYGKQIGVEDRWAIVAYLRVLSYASSDCGEYNTVRENLENMSSLEEQLISGDFNCLIGLGQVQDHYGEKLMMEIQEIINCDSYDGKWGPASKNKWRTWKEEYINAN